MIQIDPQNQIHMIQGDTAIFAFRLDNYTLQSGDCVFFTLKKNLSDPSPVIQKSITAFEDGSCRISLTAADTDLPCGDYVYDVQCNLADGRVDTVIGPCYFHIIGGVTNDSGSSE